MSRGSAAEEGSGTVRDRRAGGLRILVVAPDILLPDTHGGSTHVGELVSHLGEHGETLLLARRGSRGDGVAPVGRRLRKFPRTLRHVDALRTLPDALREAREFAPDVIYERCTAYGLGAMIGRALDVPVLTMVLDERFSWLSLLSASRLVATRLDLIPRAVRHKAVQVSWGANPKLFDASVDGSDLRSRLGFGPGDFVAAYTGSFKSWHGLEELVDAAELLRDRSVHFLLIGDGPGRRSIERRIRSAGLEPRFVLTGAIPYEEVPRHLAAADVCVAPFDPKRHGMSSRKGFILDPLKVFEYLAMGKPTITVRAGNIEALFDDGEHLLLVDPRRPDLLAAAIRRLADRPEDTRAMADAGRQRVLERHTWAAHAGQLASLFHAMRDERAS